MTLKNLLALSLDAVAPDTALTAKLLAAAERNIADTKLQGLSTENRFDAAYKAIMQLSMVALNANGYRTMTSKPGHLRLPFKRCQPAWASLPRKSSCSTHCASSATCLTTRVIWCPMPLRPSASQARRSCWCTFVRGWWPTGPICCDGVAPRACR